MPIGFFGWFVQHTQMLGIKYACSMKKMMKEKKLKTRRKNEL